VPVGQVDGIEIVVDPVRQLPQSGTVHADLVQVKRLFVVRLEAAHDLRSVERQVGPPERTVQRRLRHQLPQPPRRAQPFQDEQPAARHGLVP